MKQKRKEEVVKVGKKGRERERNEERKRKWKPKISKEKEKERKWKNYSHFRVLLGKITQVLEK